MQTIHLERGGVPQRRDTTSLKEQAHSSPVSGRGFPLAKSTQKAVGGVRQLWGREPRAGERGMGKQQILARGVWLRLSCSEHLRLSWQHPFPLLAAALPFIGASSLSCPG